jgi:hypothetical protein
MALNPPSILKIMDGTVDTDEIKRRIRDAAQDPDDVEIHDKDCSCDICRPLKEDTEDA